MSDSSDDGDTYGGEEPIRYPRRPGYPQRPAWLDYYSHEDIPLEDMDLRTPGQNPEDFEMPRSSRHQSYESDEDDSEAGRYEVGDYEQGVSEQREDEPYFSRHGTPEAFLPPSQPDTPQIIAPEPDLQSTRSVVSVDYPQASAFGMSGMPYPSMDDPHAYLQEDPSQGLSYGTPTLAIRPAGGSSSGGSAEESSPQFQPDVSPYPLPSAAGSMAGQGPPSPLGSASHYGPPSVGGSVSVGASPSVQELSPGAYLYQRGEHSGTGQPQKRGRESSSSSSAGNVRPQRKHHHGDQRPDVPQTIPEDQQGHTSLLGISAFGPGGHAQPPAQGGGTSYGAPDPYRRADASETQQISQAYASQDVRQPQPNPFAGMQRSAPSLYTAGAGRGYTGPPQGESSAQGAARSRPVHHAQPVTAYEPLPRASVAAGGADQPRYQPMQPAGPGVAPSDTGGASGGYETPAQAQPSRSQAESGGAGAVQPNPMEGMGASDVWKFISGRDGGGEGGNWEGPRFKVDENKTILWTPGQMHELQVIMASFKSWDEVVSLGQPLPGQHSAIGCANKVAELRCRIWSLDEDDEIRRLQSPCLEDRRVALQNLMSKYDRWADEIIGRCMLFARSKQRLNLGIAPQNGKSRLKARMQRQ